MNVSRQYLRIFYTVRENMLLQGPKESWCFQGLFGLRGFRSPMFPFGGRSAIVSQHRGDWKWMKECWDLKAYYHWKCTFACHLCRAQHHGPDSNLALDHDPTLFS